MGKRIQGFVKYYKVFKQLQELHRTVLKGKSPQIPSLLSEKICRELCGLRKYNSRLFDAQDNAGNKIEIKATSTNQGTTMINSDSDFDYLYWMYFNIPEDTITISIAPRSIFNLPRPDEMQGRISISLGSFAYGSTTVYIVNTTNNTITAQT